MVDKGGRSPDVLHGCASRGPLNHQGRAVCYWWEALISFSFECPQCWAKLQNFHICTPSSPSTVPIPKILWPTQRKPIVTHLQKLPKILRESFSLSKLEHNEVDPLYLYAQKILDEKSLQQDCSSAPKCRLLIQNVGFRYAARLGVNVLEKLPHVADSAAW